MTYAAKILADSISPAGHRLTTFEVTLPRIVLAELNTHRVFSRNSASSRAIPVKKMLARVLENPFVPATWGKNQKGMQASDEVLAGDALQQARLTWLDLAKQAYGAARHLAAPMEEGGLDVHKQITNRLLEPWLWHTCIISATEWSNFWNLRDSAKAQPEIKTAAALMHELYKTHEPDPVDYGDWHLPLIPHDEKFNIDISRGAAVTAAKISAGRCARVSYLTHDGKRDQQADVDLADSLVANGHMSPLEHPCRPMIPDELDLFEQPVLQYVQGEGWRDTGEVTHFLGNVQGWVQYRKLIPGEADIHTHRGDAR